MADPRPNRSFLGQAPIFLAALGICWIVLPQLKQTDDHEGDETVASRLGKIDFTGAFLLGVGTFTLMLPFEIGGTRIPVSYTGKPAYPQWSP